MLPQLLLAAWTIAVIRGTCLISASLKRPPVIGGRGLNMPNMQMAYIAPAAIKCRSAITRVTASLLRPALFTALSASTTSSVNTYPYWCQTPKASRSTPTASPSIYNPSAALCGPENPPWKQKYSQTKSWPI